MAKKYLGQHFLSDLHIIRKIVQSIPSLPIQCIEIGAGLGDLTQELLKIESLITYEVDTDLCSLLRKNFSHCIEEGRLEIINRNVLDMTQPFAWLHSSAYKVVSNLPYYVATHIIMRLLRDTYCKGFIVMTQKEVARKFCAKVGDSAFCALSVLAESFGKAYNLFDVPPQAFKPMPKVTSSVFVLHKYNALWQDTGLKAGEAMSWQHYFTVAELESFLKYAFCAPRKQMLKNLSKRFDKTRLLQAFEIAQIPLNARAHEVNTTNFHHLLAFLKKTYIKDNNGRT